MKHLPPNALCASCAHVSDVHKAGGCLADGCLCEGLTYDGTISINTVAGRRVIARAGVPEVLGGIGLPEGASYEPRRAES